MKLRRFSAWVGSGRVDYPDRRTGRRASAGARRKGRLRRRRPKPLCPARLRGAIRICRASTRTRTKAASRSSVRASSRARTADVDDAELQELIEARAKAAVERAPGIGGADTGAGPTHWYENYGAKNSRAWLVVDPPDGVIPAPTAEASGAQRRARARCAAAAAPPTAPRIAASTIGASRAAFPAR